MYVEAGTERAVVATCFNHDGLQAEIPGEARLLDVTQGGALGAETLAALDACRFEPTFNYRDAKPSDWPAYQVSGEKSIKRFDQRWHQIRVAGANEHNVTWELSASLGGDFGLTMTAFVAPTMDAAFLQDAIRYLHREVDRYLGYRR